MEKTNRELPNLLTVNQFCDRHKWATHGGLRQALFHRETNGLHVAVRRFGRKLLIDEEAFFEWIERQTHQGKEVH